MNDIDTTVIVKSEKISQKKKIKIVWIITALILAITMIFFRC